MRPSAGALRSKKPKGFGLWALAYEEGWTVAHAAATGGLLPEGFGLWEPADDYGRTVADVAAERGLPPKKKNRGFLRIIRRAAPVAGG